MSTDRRDKRGALNLLKNCMDLDAGNAVLLVCEDPQYGWYDEEASSLLAQTIRDIGGQATMIRVGSPDDKLPPDFDAHLERHNTIIYLARIGDEDRFLDKLPGKNVAMLYTRDVASLSSAFATINHNAMKDLKAAVDNVTLTARQITITCPLGTRLDCLVAGEDDQPDGDVTIKRFPMCVPQPILASETSGKVALTRWLTPTGSRSYSPANCQLESLVFANIRSGRIVGFDGESKCVQAIQSHYKIVSEKFGIDKDIVHSWHAGIHPACSYSDNIDDDPDRWSNNIFGSPRYVHFHTCGDYPPGEICWMVLDPTITIDAVPLWHSGQLVVQNFDETAAIADKWPELKELMSHPNVSIGIGN